MTERFAFNFELEDVILVEIKLGYKSNQFTQKLVNVATGKDNIQQCNGYWIVNDRLVVSTGKHILETLFRITHNKLIHFSAPKTNEALWHSFYWPHMCRDLEEVYIPACVECQ